MEGIRPQESAQHGRSSRKISPLWMAAPFCAFVVGIHGLDNAWIALLLFHALLAIPLVLHRDRWDLRDFGRGFRPWNLARQVAVMAGVLGVAAWIGLRLGFCGEELRTLLRGVGAPGVAFSLYFVTVNPAIEELFWRKLLGSRRTGLTASDVLYGACHAVILVSFLSPLFVAGAAVLLVYAGWSWRQQLHATGGLSLPWTGHALLDLHLVCFVAFLAGAC